MRRFSFVTPVTLAVLVAILLGVLIVVLVVRHRAAVNEVGSAAASSLVVSVEKPFTDIHGKEFTFATYRNQVRVVNVWASWSPYTATEFPVLEAIGRDYAPDDVVVIAINRKEPLERIAAYLKHLNTPIDHIIPVVDLTDAFYTSVDGYAMPETLVYDQAGNIAYRARGVFDETELRSVIEGLTKE